MKFSLLKPLAALSLAVAAGACLFSLPADGARIASALTPLAAPVQSGDAGHAVSAAADDMPVGQMISSKQTNADGEEVSLDILQAEDGVYYLADSTRNLYLFNMRNNTDPDLKVPFTSDSGIFEDGYAVSAFENLVKAYDFYADENNLGVSLHGISGKDGNVPVWVLLHYGQSYANASYSYDAENNIAFLNIGDGNFLGPLFHTTLAADVLAHEYQHAVTDISAGLYNLNEAGAISEAISDVIGALIEGHEPSETEFWLTGEDAAPRGGEPMRSAIIPAGSDRMNAKHMHALCLLDHDHTNCDFGGVHSNCTILTHMQYNLWRKLPGYFTRQRIGQLWYRTMCALTPSATFSEFASCFRAAAVALGFDDAALNAVDLALFESGLTASEDDHLVTFFNTVPGLGSIGGPLEEICVHDGGTASLPEPPSQVYTERMIYTFVMWKGNYTNVRRDEIVRADYSETDRYYTVRFEDGMGHLLKEEKLLYGEDATPPDPPERRGNQTYRYPFLGWDHPYEDVREDFTAHAVFGKEFRLYEATFLSDGKLYETILLPYGEQLALPDLTEKTRDPGERFEGWYLDEDCTKPAGEIVMTDAVTLYAKWVKAEAPTADPAPIVIAVAVPAVCVLSLATYFIFRKKKAKRK